MQVTGLVRMMLLFVVLLGGCTTLPASSEPAALANSARDQIGRLAIRGPTRPTITLTDSLDNKGAAARKTAISAGMGWLNGSIDVASQSGDEGAILLALFGLVTTPIVAAGGAVYGAAAADSEETIAVGNSTLQLALDFAPAQLQQALSAQFELAVPVSHEFVAAASSDSELVQRGFDSVLDVEMNSIASQPSANDFQVSFQTLNRVRLTSLASGQQLISRSYWRDLSPRSVSSWAGQQGAVLTTALDDSYQDIAGELIGELFLEPAIRVRGLEPVSRGRFVVGTVPGTRPLFVWSALDGGNGAPQANVEYEIIVTTKGADTPRRFRTQTMRYVPIESLEACRIHSWQVRAHYRSFGEQTTSDWTPVYRFKTEC